MINGLRGKMGREIAQAARNLGIELFPLSFTSSSATEFKLSLESEEISKKEL